MLMSALACVSVACGGGDTGTRRASAPTAWGDREPVVYAVLVAEVLDDRGTAPPVIYVMDGICDEAGQVEPSELECSASIPAIGKTALADQLRRYAEVRFISSPEAAAEGSAIRDDGLLFWLGPLADRPNGEVRVGANYTTALADERAGAVNLALDRQGPSWIVTGAAGLGGCPA